MKSVFTKVKLPCDDDPYSFHCLRVMHFKLSLELYITSKFRDLEHEKKVTKSDLSKIIINPEEYEENALVKYFKEDIEPLSNETSNRSNMIVTGLISVIICAIVIFGIVILSLLT